MSILSHGHRRFTSREISTELVTKLKKDKQTSIPVAELPNLISEYFELLEDHLSSGDSVVVWQFGRFDVVKSKHPNFGKKSKHKSKKKHDYQKVKFTAVRKLKSRLTDHADKLD